jgi:hypothetical protein
MKRIRIVGLALVAVLAMSAIASASASAAGPIWKVEGLKLEAGKSKTVKSKSTGNFLLKGKAFGFVNITITCTKESDTGTIVGGEPGTDTAIIEYTGCSAGGLCTVTEPIKTEANTELVYLLSGGKKYLADLFTPKSGTVFVSIKCGSITAEVTGNIVGELLNSTKSKIEKGNATEETEAAKGFVNFTGANSESYENSKGETKTAELKLEGNPSTLTGEDEVVLTTGEFYGAFE